MQCPKCNADNSMHENEDKDMECLCGYIEYSNKALSIPDKPKIPLIKQSESLTLLFKLSRKAILVLKGKIHKAELEKVKPNSMIDMECLILEECDVTALRKLLSEWVEKLPFDDDPVRHGITNGLLEFDSYLAELEKQQKEIFGD